MTTIKENIVKEKLPSHVAIIMDGNGRWAKRKGNMRLFGHKNAIKSVRDTTEAAAELGIKYLTLYAFSTENWNRPKYEVEGLMQLLVSTIESETETLLKNNIRLQSIGDFESLPNGVQKKLLAAIDKTAHCTGMTLVLALSYGSRWEIINAVKKLANDVSQHKLEASSIDESVFTSYLNTAQIPDPELLIRTSGEYRISNFLLFQIAYAELYFTETLWPDFRKNDFYKAILDFQGRERRFGKISEQINEQK